MTTQSGERYHRDDDSDECDGPLIRPLRILKPHSPASSGKSNTSGTGAGRPYYPPPGSSSSSSRPVAAYPLLPGAPGSADRMGYGEEAGPRGRAVSSPLDNDTSPRLNATSPLDRRGPGLGERRAHVPRPIQDPSSPEPDKDGGLFAMPLRSQPPPQQLPSQQLPSQQRWQQQQQQQQQQPHTRTAYYPPPEAHNDGLAQGVNRYDSVNTTRASRGSPPPPETPMDGSGLGVSRLPSNSSVLTTRASRGSPPPPLEAPTADGYAAGAQSSAAASRAAQYGGGGGGAARKPWTPTESPGRESHDHTTVYRGMAPVEGGEGWPSFQPPPSQAGMSDAPALQVTVLERDFQRLGTSSPPPAYSSVGGGAGSGYPQEKRQQQQQQQPQHPQNGQNPQHPQSLQSSQPQNQAPPGPTPSPAPSTNSATAQNPRSQSQQFSGQQNQQHQHIHNSIPVGSPAAATFSSHVHPQHANHPAFANDHRRDHDAHAAHPAARAATPAQQIQQIQQGQPHPDTQSPSQQALQSPPPQTPVSLQSPPPLPEGWIAHLDQNSGQYYYIHIATQATQWEFPKGPTPLHSHHHDGVPLSPAPSVYGSNNPLASPMFGQAAMATASPMFPPQTPGYAESIYSVAAHSIAPSTATAFSGPPPSAGGVNMFKVQPTNGVYFGPYLRYGNMDLERSMWMGSIMLVTDGQVPPTVHLHLSHDLSPNPRQLMPRALASHQRWAFYKYDVDVAMAEHGTERWTYAVTSHLGCTRYEFVVAGRHEQAWRFIAHSGNDFSPGTSQPDRTRLGGVGVMWKDVLQRNVECGGFHVQLGLGNQIYGDRLWKELPSLRQWLALSGRDNRRGAQWTARLEEDVAHAYFHYYTSHFDQPFLREAFAQIPHVLQIDDHDIFDGFGSYPEYMQQSHMFQNIGRVALEMYLLFQHHTTMEMLRTATSGLDLFTVTGHGWHFVKFLGPAVAVVGPDCRSERNLTRVMAGPTYQGIFPKVAMLPPTVQHCIWMLSVPLLYPRLEAVESLGNALATGKKAVNTTYNILGRVTSSVAGVVGGKEAVAQGFSHIKRAVGKDGLMGNVLNQFGELDMSELLKDFWTHDSKDLERTYVIRTLQGIAQQKGLRMTFLSGDVNCCGSALVHDPSRPNDHKTMYQLITSPIVAAPTNNYLIKVLHNNKTLYVPKNGVRSTHEPSDTKEDMMEIFLNDASGAVREHKRLMNRRNYAVCLPYDPEAMGGGGGGQSQPLGMDGAGGGISSAAGSVHSGSGSGSGGSASGGVSISARGSMLTQQREQGLSRINLAISFVVQGEGAYAATSQYGPVVVPYL